MMLKGLRDYLARPIRRPDGESRRRVRTSVNSDISRARRVFAWGVENELVPETVYGALKLVKGWRANRCDCPEGTPVKPVAIEHVQAVKPHVSRQVWALIELQRLTGARPGELLKLKPCDLDTSETPWTFTPKAHKNAHHGMRRTIMFGPKAQAVLGLFLAKRRVDRYLFSPREAVEEWHARQRQNRKTPVQPSQVLRAKQAVGRGRKRGPGAYYSREQYARAIARACVAAGVPHWHPNQLRHLAATELRRKHGIETAQVILGHRLGSSITEVYAEANVDKAKAILRKIG